MQYIPLPYEFNNSRHLSDSFYLSSGHKKLPESSIWVEVCRSGYYSKYIKEVDHDIATLLSPLKA